MTDEPKDRSLVRRILVALDANTGPASLEAALELASRLQAEVFALFLEDEELIRVSDYPHSRHVNFPTGDYERVSSNALSKQIRSIAETIEEKINAATRRLGINVQFQIVRGTPEQEVESHAKDADLVFVDRDSDTFARHALVRGGVGGLLERVERPILVWRSPYGHHGPVLVVVGASDDPTRLLAAANRLSGDPDRELIILLDAELDAERAPLRGAARGWLEERGRSGSFYRLHRGTPRELDEAVRRLGVELIVVSARRGRAEDMVSEWLRMTKRPVFLVR